MRQRTRISGSVLMLALALGGCGRSIIFPTPVSPSSSLPPPVFAPAPTWPGGAGYALRGVSLSGVVYELTPTGRTPIARAVLYCELCGEQTHTWAVADDNGYYHFSGDIAAGGGVWVRPGVPTPIEVGLNNKDFEDPPGLPALRQGSGWREVLVEGNTRFDIELVRRATTTP